MAIETAPFMVPMEKLETLWFQVSGTLCNLSCSHCFISCGPWTMRHAVMARGDVRRHLDEAAALGVRDFYLTGGEPFLNPELPEIVEDLLQAGDVTVLTNGTLTGVEDARNFSRLKENSPNNLFFRVSVEFPEEERNDRVRGAGSFRRARAGIRNLLDAGFSPIVTVTRNGCEGEPPVEDFKNWLKALGAAAPELKTLPLLRTGRAAESTRHYREDESVTEKVYRNFPLERLQCSYSRTVTSRGVFVCPILIDDENARMGKSLGESLGGYAISSRACYTCFTEGLCCSNTPTREDVKKFYGGAAIEPKPGLCCPTRYEGVDLSHIPEEVLEISYGCGSPVTVSKVREGTVMLDLGSGGGIDCFIASRLAGPEGKIIGVDMTDEMLEKSERGRVAVVERLGYDNIEFRRGLLEDIPAPDRSVDLVTSNCVINLSTDKGAVFREVFRVLRHNGRFVISDIVAGRSVPEVMRKDRKLWGECVSGALTVEEFVRLSRDAGFYGVTILSSTPYRDVEGIRFDSMTFEAHKFLKGGDCNYIGQKAVYMGPFESATDDEGHVFTVGVQVDVCTDTAEKLKRPPYAGMFTVIEPGVEEESEKPCKPGCC